MSDVRNPLPRLRALHARIDREATTLATEHGTRLHCRRGCSDCCVDDLTVFQVEADRIRATHARLLAEAAPHPAGACAFLDEQGSCRIYDARPYVCRTQGLPLRWLEEDEREEIVEQRDICPLNAAGPPLDQLPESQCWLIGPTEIELQALQDQHGGEPERVALRSLFARR